MDRKTILLTISGGSIDSLSMQLEIRLTDSRRLLCSRSCQLLPSPPTLLTAYQNWRQGYLAIGEPHQFWHRVISAPNTPIATNVSIQYSDHLRSNLIAEFNQWLSSCAELSEVREEIIAQVAPHDYLNHPDLVSFVLQTRTNDADLNLILQKFPWHEWNFVYERYPSIDIALSTNIAPISPQRQGKLTALVICGNYQDPQHQINLNPDLSSLQEHLADRVELKIWNSDPDRNSKLDLMEILNRESYDLLFFCGHSSANNQIQLNDREFMAIDDRQFKSILQGLKKRGLILAFFNSCDGLGIAGALMSVGIPYIVVMKEAVHDLVAQIFIDKFLRNAIQLDRPIHVAVSNSKKELVIELERKRVPLKDVDFLPILFQNPEQPPFYINDRSIGSIEPNPEPNLKSSSILDRYSYLKYLLIFGFSLVIIISFYLWGSRPPEICAFAKNTPGISCGEKSLLTYPEGKMSDDKEKGFKLIAQALDRPNLYKQAIEILMKDWERNHDPETAIAIENAKIADLARQDSKLKIKNIAVVIPVANTPTYIADSLLKGTAYAQQQINQSLDRDWKLRVIIADDNNNPDTAKEIANKLVKREDILAVMGHYSSQVTVPVREIYQANKLVLLSATATSDKLTNNNSSETFFFRVVPDNKIAAKYIVDNWVKAKMKIALFSQDKEFSRSLTKNFKDKIKEKYPQSNLIINEFNLGKNDRTVAENIDLAQRMGANAIVLFPDAYTGDRETNNKAEQVLKYNNGQLPILANTSVYDRYDDDTKRGTRTVKASAYKNVVIGSPWDYSNVKAKYLGGLIPKKAAKNLPDVPDWWVENGQSIDRLNERLAMAYDATLVLKEALDRSLTRLDVQREISSKHFSVNGVTGKISFQGSDRKETFYSLLIPDCQDNQCKGFKPWKVDRIN